jgi:TolB-like protein
MIQKCVSVFLICWMTSGVCFAQGGEHEPYKGIDNPKKITVAVNDFEGRGMPIEESSTLTDAFRSYLVNTQRFRVMERGQMEEIMKEQGFQASGACTDQACIVEMGQLLGVENIIAGSVGKVGGTYSLNVRLISVRTGEIVRTVNKFHKGEIDGLLTEVLPQVVADLTDQGRSAPRPMNSVVKRNVPEEGGDEKAEGEKKKGGAGKVILLIGLGAVVVGGGAAAAVLVPPMLKEEEEETATGVVEVTWE